MSDAAKQLVNALVKSIISTDVSYSAFLSAAAAAGIDSSGGRWKPMQIQADKEAVVMEVIDAWSKM